MAGQHKKISIGNIPVTLSVLLFLGATALINFWKSLSPDLQVWFTILVGLLIFSGVALIILWIVYTRRKRMEAWRRAMMAWHRSVKDGKAIEYTSAKFFSPNHLEMFSVELFKKMGYRVIHTGKTGDHGVDVHLVNPLGQVELVQCKQWNHAVGEPEVRDLAGAMLHEKAVRGFLFAPGGFTKSARTWARGKSIILADEREIGRLVESTFGD